MAEAAFRFAAAQPSDVESLVALRIAAMRESLERVGRFDPERARQRFVTGFRPEHTRLIEVGEERAGCVAVGPDGPGAWWLDHFYVDPAHQRAGLGGAVLRAVLDEADAAGVTVRLEVLAGSDANRFYRRHGFVETGREGVDVRYERRPGA